MKRAWLILILGGTSYTNPCLASISAADAADAIVGEAAGQPYLVKLGIAEAVHNRGTLKGVYGFHAAHNATEPAWVWRDARRAWTQSAGTIGRPDSGIVHGATHFGNSSDVQKGTFAGMKLTAILGTGNDATYFYKK